MDINKLSINELVYVPGDYFDMKKGARWSETIAKIVWKTQSLLGVVKSFEIKNNKNYVNVLWLVDYRCSCVLKTDLKIFPKNLRPITGVIDNFNIEIADYVNIQIKKRKINKNISIYEMSDREQRLSGTQVFIINNYEPEEVIVKRL